MTGETGEGDGIDSNGWLVINGGTVIAAACSDSADSGLDSDNGIYINGGIVIASGNMYDAVDGGDQTYAVFQFAQKQSGGQTYTLQNADGETVGTWTPANDFTCLVVSSPDLTAGEQKWDYLYSADAADALYRMACHGRSGAVYPVGSGTARPLREYIETLRDAIDLALPLGLGKIPYGPQQVMFLQADITQLAADTGFAPRTAFADGIRATIAWAKTQKQTN